MKWIKAITSLLFWVGIVGSVMLLGWMILSDTKENEIRLRKLEKVQEVCPTCGGQGVVRK